MKCSIHEYRARSRQLVCISFSDGLHGRNLVSASAGLWSSRIHITSGASRLLNECRSILGSIEARSSVVVLKDVSTSKNYLESVYIFSSTGRALILCNAGWIVNL